MGSGAERRVWTSARLKRSRYQGFKEGTTRTAVTTLKPYYVAPLVTERDQNIACIRVSVIGRFAEPVDSLLRVGGYSVAIAVAQSQVVRGRGAAGFGRSTNPFGRFRAALRDVITGFVCHPQLECRNVVAELGGSTGSCDFVTRHVLQVGLNLAVGHFPVRRRIAEIQGRFPGGRFQLRSGQNDGRTGRDACFCAR